MNQLPQKASRQQGDRRGKLRAGFNTRILLASDSAEILSEGHSRDLSLSGIYVSTDQKIAVDSPCTVTVVLSGTVDPLVLKIEGRVVRADGAGLGIVFESMDLDSYSHLKNIVRYNVDTPDEVI